MSNRPPKMHGMFVSSVSQGPSRPTKVCGDGEVTGVSCSNATKSNFCTIDLYTSWNVIILPS